MVLTLGSAWRPLFGPLQDSPLALADIRSFDPEGDPNPIDVIYPNYVAEGCELFYRSAYRWHYLSNQYPEEMFLFKCHDSYKVGNGLAFGGCPK